MSTASSLLALYVAAETAILSGQSYRMGERQLTLADLDVVRRERANLERRVQAETNGGGTGTRYQLADLS